MKRILIAVLAIVSIHSVSSTLEAGPVIGVTASGVTISGITPGGASILLSVSHQRRGYISGYVRNDHLLPPADTAGNASVTESVSPVSVWCVVDLQTGAYAFSTPPQSALRRTVAPPSAVRAVGSDQLNTLRVKHDFLEVLWVRPGTGVWRASVGDGGASDADHTVDGSISLTAVQMEALGSSPPPPDHFLVNDTLIAIDPDTMEIFAIQVPQ